MSPQSWKLLQPVRGVFPGIAEGTVWYDWYTLAKVDAAAGENKTLDAPLVYQPIFVRGGYILPLQEAGNTTSTSRKMPWSLLIALDKQGEAQGELYLDDGLSMQQAATKYIEFSYSNGTLSAKVSGSYEDGLALANITIAGCTAQPDSVEISIGGKSYDASGAQFAYENGALQITNLESATCAGIWSGDVSIKLVGKKNSGHEQGWSHRWNGSWSGSSWGGSWHGPWSPPA